jgi:glycine cleavage system H protein
VSDLFTPLGGEVIEVNRGLDSDPALVNREPYGAGWMYKLRVADASEREGLLSPSAYDDLVAAGS